MDIKNSIVAILNTKKKIIGTGFVAGENLILTCAHVIEQATSNVVDPTMTDLHLQVTVRFAIDGSEVLAQVDAQRCSPSYEKDVALLRVDAMPQSAKPLPLAPAAGSAGHNFYAYGYATVTNIQGIGARGKIVDIVDNGHLVQLSSQEPDHGMSGGPVLDEQRRMVIGMVTKGKGLLEKDQNLRNTQTTFATAMDVILQICHELKPVDIDTYSIISEAVAETQSLNVVAEVVGGDKVTHIHNYYQPSVLQNIIAFLGVLVRNWLTWAVFVILLIAGGIFQWYQLQPVAVAGCQSNPENYVILVGKFEALGTAERDVSRFIVDDLSQKLTEKPAPTNFIVCQYPRVFKNDADALTAAKLNHALVVVWGNYTPDFVEAQIQVGYIPNILLSQEILSRTLNIRVRLKDERGSSIARQIMAIFNSILLADGDVYGNLQSSIKIFQMPSNDVSIVDTGISAHVHQFVNLFIPDTQKALDEANLALKIDPGNPLLFIFQAVALQRLGKFDESMDGIEAATRLGPAKWPMPISLKANRDILTGNYQKAILSFGQLIETKPSDWYPYNMRGYLYLTQGNLVQAKTNIDRSLTLQPQENWPYTWAVAIALRQARLEDAGKYVDDALKRFPDADAGDNTASLVAAQTNNPFTPVLSAFWAMSQGSFNKAIQKADLSIQVDAKYADAYLIKGLSYCNLDKFPEAEAAYNNAIEIEPNFYLLYFLRAEVRNQQGNANGALGDLGMIQASPQALAYKPYIEAAMQGKVGCKNILTFKL